MPTDHHLLPEQAVLHRDSAEPFEFYSNCGSFCHNLTFRSCLQLHVSEKWGYVTIKHPIRFKISAT